MTTLLIIVVILLAAAGLVFYLRQRAVARQRELDDAKAQARRWVERLGGEVLALDAGGNPAAQQALADASERFTAAGGQIDQASTARQCELAEQTAHEGLYYTRAARTALGLDPGPTLPVMSGQQRAGSVSEDRRVSVEGHDYEASPRPSDRTSHYYPGGMVAGRPVPGGWYSEPWWRPALVAGTWGVGSYLVASALFSGMAGFGSEWAYDAGYDAGLADGGSNGGADQQDADQGGGYDGGGYDGGGYDGGGYDGGGDMGGGGFDF